MKDAIVPINRAYLYSFVKSYCRTNHLTQTEMSVEAGFDKSFIKNVLFLQEAKQYKLMMLCDRFRLDYRKLTTILEPKPEPIPEPVADLATLPVQNPDKTISDIYEMLLSINENLTAMLKAWE